MHKFVLRFTVLVGLSLLIPLSYSIADPLSGGVAILGDSLSTGGGSHGTLTFDSKAMWEVLKGQKPVTPEAFSADMSDKYNVIGVPEAPVVLTRGSREFLGGADWVLVNLLHQISSLFLNTEQYSWGYLVARALGVPAKEIYVAGENGARVESLPRQVDRVLDHMSERLPAKIFIMYTGNDLCAQRMEMITSKEDFGANLKNGLKYLLVNGEAAEGGTDIYVVGYLGILQILANKDILAKEVDAFGSPKTCRALRETAYMPNPEQLLTRDLPIEAMYLSNVVPPNPARMCPTLFGHPDRVKPHLNTLGNRVRSYRKIAKSVVAEVDKSAEAAKVSNRKRFFYVGDTEGVGFTPLDIAGDCFHLTLEGHSKVADAILTNLKKF